MKKLILLSSLFAVVAFFACQKDSIVSTTLDGTDVTGTTDRDGRRRHHGDTLCIGGGHPHDSLHIGGHVHDSLHIGGGHHAFDTTYIGGGHHPFDSTDVDGDDPSDSTHVGGGHGGGGHHGGGH